MLVELGYRQLVLCYPGGGGGNKHWYQRMEDGKVIHAVQCSEYCFYSSCCFDGSLIWGLRV